MTSGVGETAIQETEWWKKLDDPALPVLIKAAEVGSPTLQIAFFRIEEARALLGSANAARGPSLQGTASSARGNNKSAMGSAQNDSSLGLNLAWEIDLFGRLGHSTAARQARLDSSEADAQSTRLALEAQLADTSLARHACAQLFATQITDIASRESTVQLTEKKLSAGVASRADLARAQSGLTEAKGSHSVTRAQCEQLNLALVALTALPWQQVKALYEPALGFIPVPPEISLALPAAVLAAHPSLLSAARTADAAYEEVGVAKAARLPTLSLSGLLSTQWIGLAGSSVSNNLWSLGASGAATLFDGGAGRSNVEAAQARHAKALAELQQTLLTTVQEVENALSNLRSAQERDEYARAGLAAAQQLFDANEASWRVGRLSLFELEDSRRNLQLSRRILINAQRDRAQAWVALAKATGGGLAQPGQNSSGA